MKNIKILYILLLFTIGCKKNNVQKLIIIDQDYNEAISIAAKEDKLLFIDFYTTWCAPCKVLDNMIFQNDSIQGELGKDFVLLKYNAEIDSVFHLSKKHHVSSYPTAIVLNKDGFVVNRKYGFPGNDFNSLSKNVNEFKEESISLNSKNLFLTGYSNKINISNYPSFYIDYIDRTVSKIDTVSFNEYWRKNEDIYSEEYFSTLMYFGRDIPDSIADNTLKYKEKYFDTFGKLDSEILFYFLTSGKFNRAITARSVDKFEQAKNFAKSSLSEEWTNDIFPSYEMDFLKAQGKWLEVYEINKALKDSGELSNGAINYLCWSLNRDCDDQSVILKCLDWMKEVVDSEPTFSYLETYAQLLNKSGNAREAKKIAELAIEQAGDENITKLNSILEQLPKNQ